MRDSKFKKNHDEDDDEGADWKDSYSDLVTDLLAIFVVLFSFAMVNQSVAATKSMSANDINNAAQISIIETQAGGDMGILPNEDGLLPDSTSVKGDGEKDEMVESINSYIDEEGISEQLSVSKEGDVLLLRVAASVLFASGRAEITQNAEPILERISEVLALYGKNIKTVRIEGHTDNVPTNKTRFDSNWELSTSRSVAVLKRILEISHLEPEKFSAVGYGEHRPIADNDTQEGKALNRRVDFVIETFE